MHCVSTIKISLVNHKISFIFHLAFLQPLNLSHEQLTAHASESTFVLSNPIALLLLLLQTLLLYYHHSYYILALNIVKLFYKI